MFSKTTLINIILAVFVVLFGFKTYGVWSNGDETSTGIKSTENQEQRAEAEVVRKRVAKRMMPPESSYNVVVDRFLFSPKRISGKPDETEDKKEAGIVSEAGHVNMAAQNITLLGIVIMNKYKTALLKSPNMKQGEEKGKWVKIGDNINNFKVVDICEDKVLLKEGGQIYKALLHKKKDGPDNRIEILFKGKINNHDKK